jgi:hypothetical protein
MHADPVVLQDKCTAVDGAVRLVMLLPALERSELLPLSKTFNCLHEGLSAMCAPVYQSSTFVLFVRDLDPFCMHCCAVQQPRKECEAVLSDWPLRHPLLVEAQRNRNKRMHG